LPGKYNGPCERSRCQLQVVFCIARDFPACPRQAPLNARSREMHFTFLETVARWFRRMDPTALVCPVTGLDLPPRRAGCSLMYAAAAPTMSRRCLRGAEQAKHQRLLRVQAVLSLIINDRAFRFNELLGYLHPGVDRHVVHDVRPA